MHSRLKTDRKFSTTALMTKHVKLTQRNQYRPLPEPFDPSVMLLMVSRSSSPCHHKLINEMLKYVSINNDFTYIHDWLAIHDLLSNGELFHEYMRELESEMNEFRNQLPANQNNSTLLIQFFTQWAKTQGFTDLKILYP